MATMSYNAEDHKPLDQFDPLPAGQYRAMIVESERKVTAKGDGELLNLVWLVTEGEYEGRKVWDRVNLVNPNPKAVEIGMRQLSSICRAVGKLRIQSDSSEIHELPCLITLKIRPEGPDKMGIHRNAQNEVKGYESAKTAAKPAAPATPAKKPWERAK